MDDSTKSTAVRRERTMRFRVTAEEAREIASRAKIAGLTFSDYLRSAALHNRIKSTCDLEAVADLGCVNGDLGRVAGLLKLWLSERRGQGARPVDVEAMMNDFRALQASLSIIMKGVLK